MSHHPRTSRADPRAAFAEAGGWQTFAIEILKYLSGPNHNTWAYTEQKGSEEKFAQDYARLRAEAARTPVRGSRESQKDADDLTLDEILDCVERDDGTEACAHPLFEPEQEVSTERPRAAVVMSVLQLARQFGSLEEFRNALYAPGGITLLCSGADEMNGILKRLLRAIAELDHSDTGALKLEVYLAAGVTQLQSRSSGGPLANFTETFLQSFEQGQSMALVASSPSALPQPLRSILTEVIEMPRFDRDMLRVFLSQMYPEPAIQSEHDIPDALDSDAVARLTPDAITLACRAASWQDACFHIGAVGIKR